MKSTIFCNTCCPAFLLEVVGPQARLSAVAWLDRVTIFPLTPLLNLLPAHPVTDSLLMPVARMLAAVRTGVRGLAAAHAAERAVPTAAVAAAAKPNRAQKRKAVTAAQPTTVSKRKVAATAATASKPTTAPAAAVAAAPAAAAKEQQPPRAIALLQQLPWAIATHSRYVVSSVRPLVARSPAYTYFVRLAGGSGDGAGAAGGTGGTNGTGGVAAVVVKLCRKYGLEAHRAWAKAGLAPEILREEQLPGGWLLLEMEWLRWPEWRQLPDLLQQAPGKQGKEALGAVRQALQRAHAATSMVHGDARPCNCMVRRCDGSSGGQRSSSGSRSSGGASWEVRFVDFEWAGREGKATYPAFLNPDIPWPEGVGYGKPLQRAHDLELLAATATATSSRSGAAAAGRGRSAR
ncbi:hypothetical protein HYH02_003145 [Chlamydomonas schloesseri]|uniref:Aminoglycoside phosphotransferase domain-containing protein n=1 Tax=Chlamydomonas schloesseri TaxID=2026947 RepID=A0A835WR55_9CHLO|nr:hypothetical protein HYH02_003145 [Chlamydomonas schloesseri]|eukprot:KAG2452111.1 hypothetical protein HYH02_003145 [Chlamydomonas schloesseri]